MDKNEKESLPPPGGGGVVSLLAQTVDQQTNEKKWRRDLK